MGKPKAPEPPDYSGIAAANAKASKLAYKLGKQQLDWAKATYRSDKHTYGKIINGFLADMKKTSKQAAKDRNFYEKWYQPLERKLAAEAEDYASPERRKREMGAAQAGVAMQFDAQRENALKELEAYGIDPSSARYSALDIGVRTAQAAAQAAAGTAANNRVEDVERALRSEAINVGRGYPGQVASSYATSSQMGGGAGQLVGQSSSIGGQNMGNPTAYMGAGNQALGNWADTLNMSYNNQLNKFNAQQNASSGWGGALGLIGGIAGKAFGLAEGGAVPDPREVGAIPEDMSPSGGETTDDVPANLNVGEFVIPDDVVSWYGEKHMYSLIEKAAKEREMAKQTTGAIPEIGEARGAPVLQTA